MSSVSSYAGLAKTASQTFNIPASTLLGLVSVESGGDATAVSRTGARGATQFEPATAAQYGVKFGTSPAALASQINGAAHYLSDLGYHTNPTKALASYNAGPGNWQAGLGYAASVLQHAKAYKGLDGRLASYPDGGAATGASSASSSSATGSSSSGGGLLDSWGQKALGGLVFASLLGGGAILAVLGVTRATGLRAKAPS